MPISLNATRSRTTAYLFVSLTALVLGACGESPGEHGDGAGMFGGPVPVTILVAQPERVPLHLEYAAQTLGSREVEVRARVSGLLIKRNFDEGHAVAAGESLFTIDQTPFELALDRAQADLAAAEARLDQARRESSRLKPLFEATVVSQQEYDTAQSNETIVAADLLSAKVRVKEAKLNLEWTRVESPIKGLTSRALKSEGSLIPGPDVLLTTVTQVDPIHVLFGIADNERVRLSREVEQGALSWPEKGRFNATVILSDGSEYSHKGVMNFTDARVNSNTGTSEARAELPNPEMRLRPGQFVRIRLEGAARPAAYLIPQRAILESTQGKFVYVIDDEGKAAIRPVTVAEWIKDDWVITGGLKAGEKVIVDGVLKLGPGVPVVAEDPNAAPPAPKTS